jgi:hypothetical protein
MLYQLKYPRFELTRVSTATILKATTATAAREARISIRGPLSSARRAQVRLRPVLFQHLAELTRGARTANNDRLRRQYTAYLAYGSS